MSKEFEQAANVLLKRRLDKLVPIDDKVEIDMDYITCAEYQLFIDEMKAQGKDVRPPHWIDDRFSEGDAKKPILGVRRSDAVAFCEWLTGKEKDLEYVYRLPMFEEAEKCISLSQFGCWVNKNKNNFTVIYGVNKDVIEKTQSQILNSINVYFKRLSKFFILSFIVIATIIFIIFVVRPLDLFLSLFLSLFLFLFLKNLVFYVLLIVDILRFPFDTSKSILDDEQLNQCLTELFDELEYDYFFSSDIYPQNSFLSSLKLSFDMLRYWSSDIYLKIADDYNLSSLYNLTLGEFKELNQKYMMQRGQILLKCIYSVFMKERRLGNIPAWEGIRIVRETVED